MSVLRRICGAIGLAAAFATTSMAGQNPCPGDCDGNGSVGVNELVIGVNILLGRAAVTVCPPMDGNGNGTVAINELVAAVGSNLNGCGGGSATFADVQAIFTAQCATPGCHGGAVLAGDLDLREGASYAALVDVAPLNLDAAEDGLLRVDPGDANASFLLIKVAGTPPIEYGAQMPWFAPPLSESEVETIRSWINAGAMP